MILRAPIWQDGRWTDRSALLDCGAQATAGEANVVLVSLDWNCMYFLPSVIEHMLMTFILTVRLKARARQLDAANEKDMAAIMKAGK